MSVYRHLLNLPSKGLSFSSSERDGSGGVLYEVCRIGQLAMSQGHTSVADGAGLCDMTGGFDPGRL